MPRRSRRRPSCDRGRLRPTGDAVREAYLEWMSAISDPPRRRHVLRLQPTPPEAMYHLLGVLNDRFGGAGDYLRATGFTEDELDALATRLLE